MTDKEKLARDLGEKLTEFVLRNAPPEGRVFLDVTHHQKTCASLSVLLENANKSLQLAAIISLRDANTTEWLAAKLAREVTEAVRPAGHSGTR